MLAVGLCWLFSLCLCTDPSPEARALSGDGGMVGGGCNWGFFLRGFAFVSPSALPYRAANPEQWSGRDIVSTVGKGGKRIQCNGTTWSLLLTYLTCLGARNLYVSDTPKNYCSALPRPPLAVPQRPDHRRCPRNSFLFSMPPPTPEILQPSAAVNEDPLYQRFVLAHCNRAI